MKFDKYHPIINLIYFACIIYFSVSFTSPVFISISFVSAFIYSVKLIGKKAVIFNLLSTLLLMFFPFIYSYYNHFGITDLFTNFAGNRVTLEALFFGFTISFRLAAVLIWFSIINKIFTTDKVGYLFARISPLLSLYFSIIIRMVSQIKKRFYMVKVARASIGKGNNQGLLFKRIINTFKIISIVITGTLEELMSRSKSMKSRGYSLRHKTTFSIYRFDYRDRSLVIALFFLITSIFVSSEFEQTRMLFNPKIILMPVTVVSYIFYAIYLCYCVLPLILQIYYEHKLLT